MKTYKEEKVRIPERLKFWDRQPLRHRLNVTVVPLPQSGLLDAVEDDYPPRPLPHPRPPLPKREPKHSVSDLPSVRLRAWSHLFFLCLSFLFKWICCRGLSS